MRDAFGHIHSIQNHNEKKEVNTIGRCTASTIIFILEF